MDNKEIKVETVKAQEITSPGLTMIPQESTRWIQNTLKFLAPLGIIYFGYVGVQINDAGISLQDFVPNSFVLGSMVLYVINVAQDFLLKYVPERKILVEK